MRHTFIIVFGAVAVLAAAFGWLADKPELPAITTSGGREFPISLVKRGEALAAVGDCAVCHTAEGGVPFAGGRPLPTPFGTLYVTDITPAPRTGIGTWSRDAFKRAMRDGVARDGSLLYPAFPYDHFTRVADEDLDALYAFLMTRTPIETDVPRNRLIWPLAYRPVLAGWNVLFFRKRGFEPTAGRGEIWNRGAYLAEGLGHCGACHTPHNLLGGEETGRALHGGEAEGWKAPALDTTNPAPEQWTAEALYTYLRTGMDPSHSAAAGPMRPVVEELSSVSDNDVQAIAVYIASRMERASQGLLFDDDNAATQTNPEGAVLFAGACAGCHGAGAPMSGQGRPGLSLVSDLQEDDPTNTIEAILQGIQQRAGGAGAYMPAFADNLTTRQIAQVAGYLRARYSQRPAWSFLEKAIDAMRAEAQS
jgi:mono/diheme cytochrome c family protein